MRSLLASIAFVFALSVAGAAHTLDLDAAKASGLVGEKVDGYVAAVATDPSADVAALVADVNAKRKVAYADIAKRNGTDAGEVAKLAAQKLMERAPAGAWIHADGRWYQKK